MRWSFGSLQAFVKDNLFAKDYADRLLDVLTDGAHSKLMDKLQKVCFAGQCYRSKIFRLGWGALLHEKTLKHIWTNNALFTSMYVSNNIGIVIV